MSYITIHSIRFPDVANPNYVASKSEFVIPKPGDDGDENSMHLSGLPRGQSSLVSYPTSIIKDPWK